MVFWGISHLNRKPNTPEFTGAYYNGKKVYCNFVQFENREVGYAHEYVIDTKVGEVLEDQIMWNSTYSTDYKLFPAYTQDTGTFTRIELGIESDGANKGRLRIVGMSNPSWARINVRGCVYYTKEDE